MKLSVMAPSQRHKENIWLKNKDMSETFSEETRRK
jgi:hypothetical protein